MTSINVDRDFLDFPPTFKGPTLRPGDAAYGEARQIWNMRRSDERPAIIAQPLDTDDVVTAVKYAAARGIPVAVRSGSHGVDGNAMPGGAFVIDFSRMTRIDIDETTDRVTIQSGVKLGAMDKATQEHGLVVPAGVVTDTGAAGLTLGGGIGHNTRRAGATVDNLLSLEVVTADGRVLTVSADSYPELFWGMRGAGHNLAIATSLTYQAHRIGPDVTSGLMIFTPDTAEAIFGGIDGVMAVAPRELSVNLLVLLAPPLPGLPDAVVGTPIIVALVVYTGTRESYPAAISGLFGLARPVADLVQPTSWLEANSLVDPFEPPGRRVHLLGGYLSGLTAEIGRLSIESIGASPKPKGPLPASLITFPILGGALFDRSEDSAAFSREGAEWLLEIAAEWDDSADDATYMPWVGETLERYRPFLRANAYVNLTEPHSETWLQTAYGSPEKWARIVALKREWDPHNLLAYNKNVARAAVR